MKTPEEIKLGMIDYMEDASCVTEYGDAHDLIDSVEKGHATMADALALIRQLEQDNAQKDERIRQLERERDKAMEDLATTKNCKVCKYVTGDAHEEPCWSCGIAQRNWEWRGVEEEKHG